MDQYFDYEGNREKVVMNSSIPDIGYLSITTFVDGNAHSSYMHIPGQPCNTTLLDNSFNLTAIMDMAHDPNYMEYLGVKTVSYHEGEFYAFYLPIKNS
jgi:hypothetical protein